MRRKPNKPNHHRRGGSSNSHGRFRPENNSAKIKAVSANRDKYLNLARDAMASGDRVEAENFLQHAEHYYRVLAVLQEEDARYRAERQQEQQAAQAAEGGDAGFDDGADLDDSAVSTDSVQQVAGESSEPSAQKAQPVLAEAC